MPTLPDRVISIMSVLADFPSTRAATPAPFDWRALVQDA